jgi:hypothetical protein
MSISLKAGTPKTATKISQKDLFLKLSSPNKSGKSRWVDVSEFKGEFSSLKFGNGSSWGRKSSALAKKYIVETDKSITAGNKIDSIRLNGFNKEVSSVLTQSIRPDIHKKHSKERCVVLGTHTSCDHKTEVDHKDGRKDDTRVMTVESQKDGDFQPLSKPANDAKRQFCKECKNTNKRYDAKKLGHIISFTKGEEEYSSEIGCEGCYWYDPIAFNQNIIQAVIESGCLDIINGSIVFNEG